MCWDKEKNKILSYNNTNHQVFFIDEFRNQYEEMFL